MVVKNRASLIRPAVFEDAPGIDAVQQRNGLSNLDLRFWKETCLGHPYRSCYAGTHPGWVIEDESCGIVGCLLNVPLPVDFEGRQQLGVSSSAWGVDAEYRSLQALGLMQEWLRQPTPDLWLVGSANETAAQVVTVFRMEKIPMKHHPDALFWILDSQKFLAAAGRKKEIPGAEVLAVAGGLALDAYSALVRPGRGPVSVPVQTVPCFDERFDYFWNKLRNDLPRLRVVRDRAMLAWRFGSALERREVKILVAERGGEMAGYAVLTSRPRTHLGLDQNIIADIQALGDDPRVLDSLLGASIEESRAQRKHALEWHGYHAAKRAVALRRRPFHYQYSVWSLFYRCRDQAMQQSLQSPDLWDFCPLDTF